MALDTQMEWSELMEPQFFGFIALFFFAHLGQAITGFGGTIVTLTFAALMYPVRLLVVVLTPQSMFLGFVIIMRYWKLIDWDFMIGPGWRQKEWKISPRCLFEHAFGLIQVAFLGMILGQILFYVADFLLLKVIYGVFVILVSLWELAMHAAKFYREYKSSVDPPKSKSKSNVIAIGQGDGVDIEVQSDTDTGADSGIDTDNPVIVEDASSISKLQGFFWLFCGGIFGGLFASGGPMIVYYSTKVISDKSVFRSSLCFFWVLSNLVIIITSAINGLYNIVNIVVVAILIPFLLLGLAIGDAIHARVPEDAFRLFVFVLLLFAGGALFGNSIIEYL